MTDSEHLADCIIKAQLADMHAKAALDLARRSTEMIDMFYKLCEMQNVSIIAMERRLRKLELIFKNVEVLRDH